MVQQIRSINQTVGVSKPKLIHKGSELISTNGKLITSLARLSGVDEVQEGRGLALMFSDPAWLDIDQQTAKAYKDNLADKSKNLEDLIRRLEGRLANEAYVNSAPEELVAQTRQELEHSKQSLQEVQERINNLES